MKKKQYKLEQVLEISLDVFAKYGYKKTTLKDIANELEMTQGNIYLYVKDKRDLYEKAVIHEFKKYEQHTRNAVNEEEDILSQLISMTEASFDYIDRNNELRSILIQNKDLLMRPHEVFHDPENMAQFLNIYNSANNKTKKHLENAIKRGQFRNFNIDIIVELLNQIHTMFITQIFVMPIQFSRREMTKEIVNLLLYGIVNDGREDVAPIIYKGYNGG